MNFEVIENELDGNKPIHNFMYLTFPNESKEQLLKLISKCEEDINELKELRGHMQGAKKEKEKNNLEENMNTLNSCLNGVLQQIGVIMSMCEEEAKREAEERKEDPIILEKTPNYAGISLVMRCIQTVLGDLRPLMELISTKYSGSKLEEIWILSARISILTQIIPIAQRGNPNEIYYMPSDSKIWKNLLPYYKIHYDFSSKFAKAYAKFSNKAYSWSASCSKGILSSKSDGTKFAKTMSGLVWYGIFKSKAKIQAERFLYNPSLEDIKRFKNCFTENKYMGKVEVLGKKSVKSFHEIYLPKMLPLLTQTMLSEKIMYIEGLEVDPFIQYTVDPVHYDPMINVKVQLIWKNEFALDKNSQLLINKDNLNPEIVIVYIHGGGWLSGNGKASYLRKWSNETNAVIFSIEYRLAPESKFPAPLDDCWQSYYWIITQANNQLGINPKVLLLAADSAGANIAAALCLRAIQCNFRKPTGLILGYPALLCTWDIFRPSMLLSVDDCLIRFNVLGKSYSSYIGEEDSPINNPFISPLLMSDSDLKQFPPTRILACGRDPLRDEAYYLLNRMVKLKVRNVLLEELRMFPHGVWTLSGWSHGFPQCEVANQLAIDWIKYFVFLGLQEVGRVFPTDESEDVAVAHIEEEPQEENWEILKKSEITETREEWDVGNKQE